ncbi:NlpC/P60 family protein [Methylosinus sp. Sm6]|uniref:NlpC/P60 family protein n=1 Tax=Methylosinus sp. Sm6 TaxID=2866948 RepID=UPI00351D18CE
MTLARDDIVTAARAWISTPYRHQASCRSAGCDCLGLVRGVWRDVYGVEPEAPPPYSPDWGEAGAVEHILDAARRNMTEIMLDDMRGGDVIVFRMRERRIAKHMAILSGPSTMIHAQSGDCVREISLAPYWRRHIVAAFALPGVVD